MRQMLMTFSVSYYHKELLLRCCRYSGSSSDGSTWQKVIFIWRKQPSNLIQQPFMQAVLYCYNYKIVKSYTLQQKRLLSTSQMDHFQTDLNNFQGLNKYLKKYFFIRLKQKSLMFKKWYFTRSRSRTPAKSGDRTICNNGLRLKGAYYSIVTRSSTLNVGRGQNLLLITMIFVKIFSQLRNIPMKNTKIGAIQ